MPTATIAVKGNNCHTSLWGVMANHGFGRVTLKSGKVILNRVAFFFFIRFKGKLFLNAELAGRSCGQL